MPLFGSNAPQSIIYPTATTPVVVATSIGITLSAFYTGGTYALSYITLPALLLPAPVKLLSSPDVSPDSDTPKAATASAHLARQWQRLYHLGQRAIPITTIGSTAALLYACFQLPENMTTQRTLFGVAATLTVSVAPFTWLVMQGTTTELHLRADAAGEDSDSAEPKEDNVVMGEAYQTQGLIQYWGTLNMIRGNLPLASIACAIAALVY